MRLIVRMKNKMRTFLKIIKLNLVQITSSLEKPNLIYCQTKAYMDYLCLFKASAMILKYHMMCIMEFSTKENSEVGMIKLMEAMVNTDRFKVILNLFKFKSINMGYKLITKRNTLSSNPIKAFSQELL